MPRRDHKLALAFARGLNPCDILDRRTVLAMAALTWIPIMRLCWLAPEERCGGKDRKGTEKPCAGLHDRGLKLWAPVIALSRRPCLHSEGICHAQSSECPSSASPWPSDWFCAFHSTLINGGSTTCFHFQLVRDATDEAQPETPARRRARLPAGSGPTPWPLQ